MVSDEEEEEESGTFFPGLELDSCACDPQHDINIGPIRLDDSIYRHEGPSYAVDVQDQPEKVKTGTFGAASCELPFSAQGP